MEDQAEATDSGAERDRPVRPPYSTARPKFAVTSGIRAWFDSIIFRSGVSLTGHELD
jgi:hypothetical protein